LRTTARPTDSSNFGVGQDDKDSSKQIAEIYQGGLSLPDRDYYIVDSARFKAIRAQYIEHVKKMFTLAGDTPEQAAKEAAAVMEIETALAKASTSRTDLRDPENRYHIYTVADFEKLAPDFDWKAYFKAIGIGHFDTLNVATPDFFKALSGLIQSEPLDSWKSYLRWHALHGQARTCPRPSSTRTSPSSARRWPDRRSRSRAGSSAPRHDRQCAGRGRGPGLGEAELSARGQGQHGQAGGRAGKVAGRRHQDAALDERRPPRRPPKKSWP
jgi:hypothetical protein